MYKSATFLYVSVIPKILPPPQKKKKKKKKKKTFLRPWYWLVIIAIITHLHANLFLTHMRQTFDRLMRSSR